MATKCSPCASASSHARHVPMCAFHAWYWEPRHWQPRHWPIRRLVAFAANRPIRQEQASDGDGASKLPPCQEAQEPTGPAPEHWQPARVISQPQSRREIFLNSHSMFALLLLIGTDDPTTILNAVLSGYGLPMLQASKDFKAYDEFENEWYFSYPRSWVARPNTQRSGFYVSNFQTADKATVESFPVPPGASDADVVRMAVAAAVVPGMGQADDKLTLPPDRSVKSEETVIDGQRYVYLTFPSETLTRSGYAIKRRHWAVVAVKKGVAYTLSASARSDQYNADKEVLLRQITNSFRLR